jgi:hypothetical protein
MKTILMVTAIGLLFACKKENNTTETPLIGTIDIAQPLKNDTLIIDSMFTISTFISANKELHGHYLVVYNQLDQSVVYEHQVHEHGTTYSLNDTVAMTISALTPLRIVVEAAGDHAGELITKERLFWLTP